MYRAGEGGSKWRVQLGDWLNWFNWGGD
jgi:hypothetical protein